MNDIEYPFQMMIACFIGSALVSQVLIYIGSDWITSMVICGVVGGVIGWDYARRLNKGDDRNG